MRRFLRINQSSLLDGLSSRSRINGGPLDPQRAFHATSASFSVFSDAVGAAEFFCLLLKSRRPEPDLLVLHPATTFIYTTFLLTCYMFSGNRNMMKFLASSTEEVPSEVSPTNLENLAPRLRLGQAASYSKDLLLGPTRTTSRKLIASVCCRGSDQLALASFPSLSAVIALISFRFLR